MTRAYERLRKKLDRKSARSYDKRKPGHLNSLIKKQDNICYLCGTKMKRGDPELRPTRDHVKSLSKVKNYANKEIKAAHSCCNSAKGNLTLKEFYALRRTFNVTGAWITYRNDLDIPK